VGATGDGVEFILREGYLEALHRGTYAELPYKAFIAGSIQACKDHGVDLLFVDIAALSGFNPTATQRYDMGNLASRLGKELRRVAIFGTPEQIEKQFGTLVARNRGLNIQAYTDRGEALTWLKG
jgi:hypothetical protein